MIAENSDRKKIGALAQRLHEQWLEQHREFVEGCRKNRPGCRSFPDSARAVPWEKLPRNWVLQYQSDARYKLLTGK